MNAKAALPVVAALCIALAPIHAASALALSDMELHSYLNQPLDARVRLLAASEEELGSLSVSMHTGTAARTTGGPALKYEIVKDENGAYLHITTKEPVREPIMNVVVDVNWSKGHLVREYSLIVDFK